MLADRLRLLERWVQAYIARMRPGLVVERYRPARADWWQDAELADGLWSGETAAALLTQSLKPQTFTVFGGQPSHDFVLRHSLQKDADGTVEFLKPFWRTPQDRTGGSPCVHPYWFTPTFCPSKTTGRARLPESSMTVISIPSSRPIEDRTH